ncbi:MAG TPA: PAS domain-containing protein [Solirubrobacteraceae bacterium]|nr:PAS domain-containing protein [Solirubrobacteraceae bacterium]
MTRRAGEPARRRADRAPDAPADLGAGARPDIDLARALDALPEIVFVMSREGEVTWTNAVARAAGGYQQGERDASPWARVHPADVPAARAIIQEALEQGAAWEVRVRRAEPGGQFGWLLVRASPLCEETGTTTSWIGVATVIDREMQAVGQLESLFAHAPIGLAFLDNENRVLRANELVAGTHGLTPDSIVGQKADELAPELWPQVDPLHALVLQPGEPGVLELELGTTSAGDPRRWLLGRFPVKERGAVTGVGIVRMEVTELRRAQAQLSRLAEERRRLLEALVRAHERERRAIASDIHGDTLQVFAAVRLTLEELGEGLDDPAQRSAYERFSAACLGAERRLREMLFELWPPSLDRSGMRMAIEEALGRLESDAGLSTGLRWELPQEPPLDLRGVMFRVVSEALANARQHARASHIDVECLQRDGTLVLRIHDDGVGFSVRRPPAAGHVGLAEMRQRVDALGGALSVRSSKGRGTTIEARFPFGGSDAERGG